jgi:hypothetical protein
VGGGGEGGGGGREREGEVVAGVCAAHVCVCAMEDQGEAGVTPHHRCGCSTAMKVCVSRDLCLQSMCLLHASGTCA